MCRRKTWSSMRLDSGSSSPAASVSRRASSTSLSPGCEEGLGEQHAQRLRVARHPAAEHARDLERLLEREAHLGERGRVLGGLEVLVGVDARVGVRHREAERLAELGQVLDVEARLLGDLALRVVRAAGQEALDRQQHEPVLLHRLAQLVDARALVVEVVEQLAAGVALPLVLEPLEQPFGFPVHGPGKLQGAVLLGEQVHQQPVAPRPVRRAARSGASRRRGGSRPPRRRGSRARWRPPGRSRSGGGHAPRSCGRSRAASPPARGRGPGARRRGRGRSRRSGSRAPPPRRPSARRRPHPPPRSPAPPRRPGDRAGRAAPAPRPRSRTSARRRPRRASRAAARGRRRARAAARRARRAMSGARDRPWSVGWPRRTNRGAGENAWLR